MFLDGKDAHEAASPTYGSGGVWGGVRRKRGISAKTAAVLSLPPATGSVFEGAGERRVELEMPRQAGDFQDLFAVRVQVREREPAAGLVAVTAGGEECF